jgi:hypothetical protein
MIPDIDCQQLLGSLTSDRGGSRRVYYVKNNPDRVIKEVRADSFVGTNFIEWFVWNWIKDTGLREVFGECFEISETGRYLIMERLDDLAEDEYSKTPSVPDWLTDVWHRSFGKNRERRIKIRDYNSVRAGAALETAELWRCAWQGPEPR